MPVWLANLLGGGLIDKVLSFIPNPAEQAKAKLEMQSALMEAAIKADADQRDINKTEAASGSLFVAGARPAVMWLCVFTLAWQWDIAPLVTWFVRLFNANLPALPMLGTLETQTLLYSLLGLGGYRTVEKGIGVATQKIQSWKANQ